MTLLQNLWHSVPSFMGSARTLALWMRKGKMRWGIGGNLEIWKAELWSHYGDMMLEPVGLPIAATSTACVGTRRIASDSLIRIQKAFRRHELGHPQFPGEGHDKCFRTIGPAKTRRILSESGDIRGDQSGKTGSSDTGDSVTGDILEMLMECITGPHLRVTLNAKINSIRNTANPASQIIEMSTLTPSPGCSHPLKPERRTLACEAAGSWILPVRCWKYDQSWRDRNPQRMLQFMGCLLPKDISVWKGEKGEKSLRKIWEKSATRMGQLVSTWFHLDDFCCRQTQIQTAHGQFLWLPTQANRSRSAWSSCEKSRGHGSLWPLMGPTCPMSGKWKHCLSSYLVSNDLHENWSTLHPEDNSSLQPACRESGLWTLWLRSTLLEAHNEPVSDSNL